MLCLHSKKRCTETRLAKLALATPSLEVTTLVTYNGLLDAIVEKKPLTMKNLMTTKPFDCTYNMYMYHVVTSVSRLECAESRGDPAPSGGDPAPSGGDSAPGGGTMVYGRLMTMNLDLSYNVHYVQLLSFILSLNWCMCASLNHVQSYSLSSSA